MRGTLMRASKHTFALLAMALLPAPVWPATTQPPLVDLGYRDMYNLDFAAAHRCFAQWRESHPDDPMGPVSDAAAYLFTELDRMHLLQSELFVDDKSFFHRREPDPDPVLKQQFESALDASQRIAGRALEKAPGNRNAEFASVLEHGLQADYLALVDKSYLASLTEVKTARKLAEKLLAEDPSYYDAYLAIGVENYLLSLKPLPVRWLLHMAGAETDKETGLAKLRLTAEHGRYLAPYARLLLAVAALRDKDRERARQLLRSLSRDFPRNRLYTEELVRLQ